MANSTTHAALPYPIQNARFTLAVPYLDADGDPTDPTTPDTEVSKDAGAFADCAEEVTTISGSNGVGYITLTGAETNCALLALVAKVASGPKATIATIYPRNLPILSSGTLSAGSAGGGTLGTVLAYDVAGCFLRTTGGTGGGGTGGANNQVRRLITYTPSTGAFTVSPNWETTPDATTTYDVLCPEGISPGILKALNPTTAGRTLDVNSAGEAGLDWANIGGPTTTVNLSGTTVKTATDVETDTQDIQSRLPSALGVNGNIKADVRDYNGAAGTFASGRPEVNTTHWKGTTAATADAAGYPVVTVKDGTGQGEIATTSGAVDTVTTLTNAPGDSSGVTTLLSRLTALRAGYLDNLSAGAVALASTFTGITSLAQWLGLLAGKQTGNSTARTELRATGAGSGTFDETTDAQEAIRDNMGTAQTGDAYARLGAPAGASVSADIAAVQADADDVQTRLPAALVSGRIDASVGAMAANVVTATAIATDAITAGKIAADAIGASELAADAASEIASAVRTELTTELARVDVAVSTRLATSGYAVPPTAAAVADQVWEEAIADHSGTAGSTAEALSAAGSAGDPWSTAVPGAYSSGTAGNILGNRLDVAVSTRLASGSYTAPPSAATIAAAVWDYLASAATTVGSLGKLLVDNVNATIASRSSHSAADVWAVGTRTLTSFGTLVADVWAAVTRTLTAATNITSTGGTTVPQTGDAFARLGAPAGASVSADVAAVKVDTAAIKAKTDNLPASPAATGDIPSAAAVATQVRTELTTELARVDAAVSTRATPTQVNAEVVDALATDTYAEPGQGAPAATASLAAKVGYLFKAWRNRTTQDASTQKLYADDGTTVDQKATLSDDGTEFVKGEQQTGP